MSIIPSFTVEMDIFDVLYLSYFIPEKRLRHTIPSHIPFALSYENKTIISLVIFRSINVASSLFPFLHFSYNQANIRTYVVDPITGSPAVFFIKSGITSAFVSFAARVLKIPWHSISMSLDVRYENNRPVQYRVWGNWEEDFNIELERGHSPLDHDPFQSMEERVRFLTGPAVGFYGASGKLIRFEVNHSAVKPSTGKLSTIQCPILVSSGLMNDKELLMPQSILMAPYGHFTVFMPPTTISTR
jgi:hypothetical protein